MASNTVSFDLELAVKGFEQNLKKVDNNLGKFHKDFQKSASRSSQAWASFAGNLAANAVGALARGMGDFAKGTVDAAISLEKMSTELGVMLGSAKAGQKQLEELQQFAATTPFQLTGIVDATKKLLSFGVASKDIQSTLTTLGNIAAGSGKPIEDLARIFGQVRAEGKLTLERLNQLNDSGIALGTVLATNLNKSVAEVRKEITKGSISFGEFKTAMNDIQGEGGIFAQGMIKQSKTLGGVLSTLSDNIFNFQGQIGQALLPAIKSMAIAFIETIQAISKPLVAFIGWINENSLALKVTLSTALAAATGALVYFNAQLIIMKVQAALAWAAALAPVTLVVAGVALVGVALFKIVQHWDNIKRGAQLAMAASLEFAGRFVDAAKEKAAAIREEIAAEDAAKQAIIDKEAASVAASEARVQRVALEKAAAEELKAQKMLDLEEENLLLASRELTEEEVQERVLEIQRKAALDYKTINAKRIKDTLKAQKEAGKKTLLEEVALDKQQRQRIIDMNNFKVKLAEIDANNAAKGFQLGAQLAKDGSKEQFLINKAGALAQIYVNDGLARSGAFAQTSMIPYPANLAALAQMNASISLNTGLATGIVAAQSIKGYERGGIIPGSSFTGDSVQANVNSGEMILNRGQQAQLFQDLNNGGGGDNGDLISAINSLGDRISSMEIIVQADDTEIARSVSRGVQNGIVIGESR